MNPGKLVSWGRYPYSPQHIHSTIWRSDFPAHLSSLCFQFDSILPFGNGRSYGDSCLSVSNHLIGMRQLNRFISFDVQKGLLIAEAGVTLEEILKLSIPRGWFLPVTPGTKFVTLGGAIANDVHGKNHHVRGTFGCHVKRFNLIRSDQPPVPCSLTENSSLFKATVGGLGLTGIIEWAELQLIPIESSLISEVSIRFNSIKEFIALSNDMDHQHEYSVAWVDCCAKEKSLGRGIFIVGDHCASGDLILSQKRKINIPFTPPISMINQFSLKAFNTYYFHKHSKTPAYHLSSYDSFFYPLDGINNWNRIYGPKGFQQYQCVIPEHNMDAISELLRTISNTGLGSFLAVLKRCGNILSPGLLSFPLPGISLALDFAQSAALDHLFPKLDEIVRSAQGRLYPAKDAHMPASDFQRYYPNWEELHKLKDPHFCSHFWKRVSTQ